MVRLVSVHIRHFLLLTTRFLSENNTHEKARLRFFSPWGEREGGQKRYIPLAAASGTQTCLVDFGDPCAEMIDIKLLTAYRGGKNAAAYTLGARRRAGRLRSVYVGERWHDNGVRNNGISRFCGLLFEFAHRRILLEV